jgi:hypothetical protein
MRNKTFAYLLLVGCISVCFGGCNRSVAVELPIDETLPAEMAQENKSSTEKQEPASDKEAERSAGYLNKLKGYYEKAKSAGMSSAGAAQGMIGDSYQQLMSTGGATLSQSAEWANGAYKLLKDQGLTTAGNVTEWLSSEIAKSGQWEYHVVTIVNQNELEKTLNELGKERWECFEVLAVNESLRVVCKRQVKTYLSHIPSGDVIKLLNFMKPNNN